ncbi:MAG: hypothetical protein U9R42_04605 [Bacteroidota bacterium]|nr:hypothetical protein [Bacteroidota bacterium]
MKKKSSLRIVKLLTLSILLLFLFFSCRKENFIEDPSAKLKFSTDTVLFDTVFLTYGSVTKKFMVYNDHKKSIKIEDIRLGRGENSPYRINIDGEPTTKITDYTLLPNDSIYIFVDVTINPDDPDLLFIEKDSITFLTNGNMQDIKLVAWGQDAHFFRDSMLTGNIVWENDKPYVISNHIGVDENSVLNIKEGVEIYSDTRSAIFVWGTLNVEGSIDEPVLFRGLRLDEYYDDIPGQWYGIYFIRESKDNYIKNASIRNATVGVRVDSMSINSNPNLVLENVRIENMSSVGILGYSAHIIGYNCLVDNCCQYLVYGDYGGKYEFYHSTFAHSSCVCLSQTEALAFYNTDNKELKNDLDLTIVNSIIWGSKEDEIDMQTTGQGNFNVFIDHTLIKTDQSDLNINDNILNQSPKFVNECNYKYSLDTLSNAKDKGAPLTSLPLEVSTDITGKSRNDGNPDLGAFER